MNRIYYLRSVLYNTKVKNYQVYRGRKEFCLHCIDYGMRTYDYGKEFVDGKRMFNIVGFFENTTSKYILLMGVKGGLYIVKA